MKSFILRHQILITSLVLCLIALNTTTSVKKGTGADLIVQNTTDFVISPLQNSILSVKNIITSIGSDYLFLVHAKKENDDLKHKLAKLENEKARLTEALIEQQRLKEILSFTDRAPFGTVTASILAESSVNSSAGWTRTITINKGSAMGITLNMPVIVQQGLVGRIVSSKRNTSTVLLLTDPRSNIGTLVQRTRVKGIINGNGTGNLNLKYVRELDDINVGDNIITTGLSLIFPKGIVVGEVVEAKKGTDNFFKSVKIKPTVDFNEIEEVMVVTYNMEEVKDLLDEEQVREHEKEQGKPHRPAR